MKAINKRFRTLGALLAMSIVTLATIGSALALPQDVPLKTSFSTDFSDLWWNPSESGWGMQMVQTGGFIFATVYAYGTDGKPTWFVGGLNGSAANTFAGTLFVATGPYFGGPFNPAAATVRAAGTMQFQATSPDAGLLTYSVDGVEVKDKPVQRQPLTLDGYSGTYSAIYTETATNCANAGNNGTTTGPSTVQITQSGASMAVILQSAAGGSCSAAGTYSQLGRSGRLDGSYTCTSGETGSALIFELNNHVRQFNGRTAFQSTNTGCLRTGRITGLIPN